MFRAGVTAASPAWSWAQLSRASAGACRGWPSILTGPAALAALDAGASAILVSNHRGRQVDPAPASLDVLPEVASAVAGRVPSARSGHPFRRGRAAGPRPRSRRRRDRQVAAYGLAAAGEAGVRRVIELLAEELRTLMVLAGLPDIKSITADTVARR